MPGIVLIPYANVVNKIELSMALEYITHEPYNVGLCLNYGISKNPDYDYYVFHDVNTPFDFTSVYSKFSNNDLPIFFENNVIVSKEHILKVNGLPNNFFGRGLYTALYNRFVINNIQPEGLPIDFDLKDDQYNLEQIENDKFIWQHNGIVQYKKYDNLWRTPIVPRIYPRTDMWFNPVLMPNLVLFEAFKTGKFQNIHLASGINPVEGKLLYDLITMNKYTKTLEVGMAMGLSCAYILQAIHDSSPRSTIKHIIIDPFQTTQFKNIGIKLLRACKLDAYKLYKQKSYFALPTLARKHASTFDLIFIDGYHTFDYTLIDFFYSDILLHVNGIIVMDDFGHPGPRQACEYISANYKHYILLQRIHTMAIFIKVADDFRPWNFHVDMKKWIINTIKHNRIENIFDIKK